MPVAQASVEAGIEYVEALGLTHFDEVSASHSWMNEQLARLAWRERVTAAAVPQVVLVERRLTAALSPVRVTFTPDSIVRVVRGGAALIQWVREGTPLTGGVPVESSSTTPTGR